MITVGLYQKDVLKIINKLLKNTMLLLLLVVLACILTQSAISWIFQHLVKKQDLKLFQYLKKVLNGLK